MSAPVRVAARWRGQRGQSTVELVAMLPVLFAVVWAVAQLLLAGAASEYAGHAAEAGAVAMLEGGDPAAAARDAVPGWSRSRLVVEVDGAAVRVAVRPPSLVPALAVALTAHAQARAGR
jgi:nitrogen fixation protein FixH